MHTDIRQGTAKIYEFPRKLASTGTPRRGDCHVVDFRLHGPATVDFGSGWYHETAVQADRVRKP